MALPGTSAAGFQVDFQVAVTQGGVTHGLRCGAAQGCATQVGVDDNPGSVDDGRGVYATHPLSTQGGLGCDFRQRRGAATVQSLRPRLLDGLANGVYQPFVAEFVGECLQRFCSKHPFDAGQVSEG